RFEAPDGTTSYYLTKVGPVVEDGEVAAFSLIVTDVTEHKRTRNFLEAAAKVSSDLIYEWDLFEDTLAWRGDVEKALGYPDAAFMDSIEGWVGLIHPEDQLRLRDAVERHRTDTDPIYEIYRMRHADGEWRDWEDVGTPIVEDGRPVRWIGACRDITDRSRAEQALRESEARFRNIVQSSPMGMFMYRLEPDGRLVFTGGNPAADEMLGIDSAELVGKTIEEAFPPLADTEIPTRYREAAANGTFWSTEQVDYADERIEGAFEVYAFQTAPGAMAVMFLDVTERRKNAEERRKLELQVLQAQKSESLGMLAGGIAHDFNNLLMGILGNADLALMDLAPESPARESVQAIETAARRAADLSRQMLAYSGKGKFIIKRLDLQTLIEEMIHLLEVSIAKGTVIKYDFADKVPPIEADATQIRQIVMNLVVNASEAIGAGSGVITVHTGAMDCDADYFRDTFFDVELPPGPYAFFEISDTGCGMDAETVDRIFDPFFSTKFTGRGLGLAAVLGIVRGHEGAIKVYSEPGKGSTFKVLFPVTGGTADLIETAEPEEVQADLAGATVMLVDDEKTVRDVGRQMLDRLGLEVHVCASGQEALDLFAEDPGRFDCVILDLTMPPPDGEVTFRELRRLRKDVRVVLSSGYNEQDLIARFASKGLAGFIQKPYVLRRLREVLAETLA
ncbi:PAS domain S-box protein, partial [bacterium]|nr:PAS domain S-box protein [bacterium]